MRHSTARRGQTVSGRSPSGSPWQIVRMSCAEPVDTLQDILPAGKTLMSIVPGLLCGSSRKGILPR